jgi:hypothetical protein
MVSGAAGHEIQGVKLVTDGGGCIVRLHKFCLQGSLSSG